MQCAARQRPTELMMINNPKCAGPTVQHVGRNKRSALRRSCLAKFVEFARLVFRNKVGSPDRDETMIRRANLARACATSAARRRNALRLLRPTAVAYDRSHPRPPALHTSGWPDRVQSRQSQETGPSRPVFGDNIAQVLGRKLTAPVGRQAVARLPRPQSIYPDRHGPGCRARLRRARCDPAAAERAPARSAFWPCCSFFFLAVRGFKIGVRQPRPVAWRPLANNDPGSKS